MVRNGQPHSFPVTTCSLGGLGCVWSGAKAGGRNLPHWQSWKGLWGGQVYPWPFNPTFLTDGPLMIRED